MQNMNEKVKVLQGKPQPVQRTPEWYKQRQTRVTASEAASCLYKSKAVCEEYVKQFGIVGYKFKESEGLNPYESREDYIIKKCDAYNGVNNFKDNVFTLWGKKYEEVANRLYMQLKNVVVHEFGLISHEEYEWLAASPDGITDDGVMLEIKCPKSRKINTEMIPLYYWVQVQIQLETCDLDECDFLECEIDEHSNENAWRNAISGIRDGEPKSFGIVLCKRDEQVAGSDPVYIYPPVEKREVEEYIDWAKAYENCDWTYYVINKYHITNIKRSKEWFENVKGTIKETWGLIRRLQENEEDFKKYKGSIHKIKSKKFYEKFHQTTCDIDTVSEEVAIEMKTKADDKDTESIESPTVDYTECLIE